MSAKKILMLGCGFMQGVAITRMKDRGWKVTAVDGNPNAPCKDLAHRFEPIDLKDIEKLEVLARELKESEGLDGVFTAATDFTASVSYLCSKLGLPAHSYEASLNASNKLRMRNCFSKAGVPSPSFVGVHKGDLLTLNQQDLQKKIDEAGISYPFVVKPVDNMGARGCRDVSSSAHLMTALEDAIQYSRTEQAIIEEYMEGPEFSIEGLVYDGNIKVLALADRHIFFPPYFIEMGHTIPSNCPSDAKIDIENVFIQGVKALGLTHGVVKGDIKLTKKGAMVGEIAGRLSGGYMSGWTFPYSSGIDITSAALDLAVGITPTDIKPTGSLVCAERAWISIPGKISSISGIEAARSIKGVIDVFPRSQENDLVDFPKNNVEKCGNCLAVGQTRSEAIATAEEACRTIFLRLCPNVKSTSDFLDKEKAVAEFPPSAFAIPLSFLDSTSQSIVLSTGLCIALPLKIVEVLDRVKDWHGFTLREALESSILLENQLGPLLEKSTVSELKPYLVSIIRGSIQGIIYRYDSDKKNT